MCACLNLLSNCLVCYHITKSRFVYLCLILNIHDDVTEQKCSTNDGKYDQCNTIEVKSYQFYFIANGICL